MELIIFGILVYSFLKWVDYEILDTIKRQNESIPLRDVRMLMITAVIFILAITGYLAHLSPSFDKEIGKYMAFGLIHTVLICELLRLYRYRKQ